MILCDRVTSHSLATRRWSASYTPDEFTLVSYHIASTMASTSIDLSMLAPLCLPLCDSSRPSCVTQGLNKPLSSTSLNHEQLVRIKQDNPEQLEQASQGDRIRLARTAAFYWSKLQSCSPSQLDQQEHPDDEPTSVSRECGHRLSAGTGQSYKCLTSMDQDNC